MKNKKVIISIILTSIVLIALVVISTTQAYFNNDIYAKNPTEYQSGLLSIEAVSKSNNISLDNTLPMSDDDGLQTTPYVFTIKNNGNVDYKFNIKLLSTSENTFSPEYIKLKIDDEGIRTFSSLTDSIIKQDVILPAGETIDISIRIWLSSDTKNTEIGKTFNSKIVIDGQSVYTTTNSDPYRTYKITYNANGGSGELSSQTKIQGTALTLSSITPTKENYTFLGWSTSSTATTATYQPGDTFTIDQNTTLYAVWKSNVVTYTVVLKQSMNGITTLTTQEVESGSTFEYTFQEMMLVGYNYSSVSCTNGQTITTSLSFVTRTVTISSVTSDTICTIYYTKKSSGTETS